MSKKHEWLTKNDQIVGAKISHEFDLNTKDHDKDLAAGVSFSLTVPEYLGGKPELNKCRLRFNFGSTDDNSAVYPTLLFNHNDKRNIVMSVPYGCMDEESDNCTFKPSWESKIISLEPGWRLNIDITRYNLTPHTPQTATNCHNWLSTIEVLNKLGEKKTFQNIYPYQCDWGGRFAYLYMKEFSVSLSAYVEDCSLLKIFQDLKISDIKLANFKADPMDLHWQSEANDTATASSCAVNIVPEGDNPSSNVLIIKVSEDNEKNEPLTTE